MQQHIALTMRQLSRLLPRQSPVLIRPFSTSRTFRLKEDADRSPEEVEKAKQDSLKGKDHRGTASASEEHVAAEREEVKDHDKHMEDLQKETANKSQENHPQGKS